MSLPHRIGAALALAMLGGTATSSSACAPEEHWPSPSHPAATEAQPLDTAVVRDVPLGPHPRILLTAKRLSAVRGLVTTNAPAWRRLAAQCDDSERTTIESGYEAWDWANASLALALCYQITQAPHFAEAGTKYLRALLDDRRKIGDAEGGDAVVRRDHGYSIRAHGCLGALAYDWLHDAPGVTPELRKHAADRFLAWTKWFSEDGYNRDEPIANYYAGYFCAVALGGIVLADDDARAPALRTRSERMFRTEVVPAFGRNLDGGDFPEGWQYGDFVGAVLAIYADAQSQHGGQRTSFEQLPWLTSMVRYRAHALWPDGKHTFDTGDWSDKPAVAPAHALLALSTVLPDPDKTRRQALFLARLASDANEEWLWLATLGDDGTPTAEDPRGGSTSYLAPGTGVVLARTSWTPDAVWLGLSCAPSLSDHQHLDAGHFEIVRGADALVVDPGGYGSYSSLSHNVIAIDDGREHDPYSPNQGTWSREAKIARFEDRGPVVYALADYASAYNPPGYPKEHGDRSVLRAERELLFSRSAVSGTGPQSARVVVYDRITLARPAYGATFLLHGGSAPALSGRKGVRFVVGNSEAWETPLLPEGAAPAVVREPTRLGEGPYYANEPAPGTTRARIEVRSPRGDAERRFLNAIIVTGRRDAGGPLPQELRLSGDGIDGVAIDDEAYIFAHTAPQIRAMPLAWNTPQTATRQFVASLAPAARYRIAVTRDGAACHVKIDPGEGGRDASGAGLLIIELTRDCQLR